MLDDFDDLDVSEEEVSDGGSNRSFLMVAGGIGALIIVSLVMLAAYIFILRPEQAAAPQNAAETQAVQQATSEDLTEDTAPVDAYTPTVTNTPVPATATEETVQEAQQEEALAPTQDPRTATVQALLTQASIAQTQAVLSSTATPTPDGTLPNTGFMDDFGAGGLLSMGVVLIIVIFLARRLRQVNA